jgi:hypothetical protein
MTMMRSGRARYVSAMLLLGMTASALVTGCGTSEDVLPRQRVGGTVKWNGEPLKQGRIQFQPTGPGGLAGGAGIVDGTYAIPLAEGLVPGKYQVLIYGAADAAQPSPAQPGLPGEAPPPKKAVKDPIPDKFNIKSRLTAEVTKDGPNEFPFELTDK